MAADHKVEIEIKTRADTAGAEQAAEAVQKVGEAASGAAQQQEQGAAAAETLEDRIKRLSESVAEAREQTQDQTQAAAEMDITHMRAALGVAAVAGAATAAAAALSAWVRGNEDLSNALGNATEAGKNFTNEVLQGWLGEGRALQGVLNDITRLLGGQTEAMKLANEPLRGYTTAQEEAAEAAKKFTAGLRAQEDALKGVSTVLQDQLTVLREQLRTRETIAELQAEEEKRRIAEGSGSAAEKARQTAEVEKNLAQEKLNLRTEGRTAGLQTLNTEVRARENELAKSKEALAAQQQRAKAAERLELAGKNVQILQADKDFVGRWKSGDEGARQQWQKAQEGLAQARTAAQGVGTLEAERGRLPGMEQSIAQQEQALSDARRRAATAAKVAEQQQVRDEFQTRAQQAAAEGRAAKVAAAEEAEPAPAPEAAAATPDPLQAKVTAAGEQLTDLAQGTGDAGAKANLEDLKRKLEDGRGNTEAELQAVLQMLEQIRQDPARASEALQQAMTAVQGISQQITELGQNTANGFTAAARAIEQTNSTVRSVVAQVERIESARNSMA